MKRKTTRLVLAGALALLSMALPSCKKGCYECIKGADTEYVCSDDYSDKQHFNADLDYLKAYGYSCKKQ